MESPAHNCARCTRLVALREELRVQYPDWHNAPVPSFGDLDARLLVVGLAPGLRGANRTGRPFTGDYAGDLLYATLVKFGFAAGAYGAQPEDGLQLIDCRVTNAVRCLPPENKPIGAEVNACAGFLESELAAMPNLEIVLSLGGLSHKAVIKLLKLKQKNWKFGHGAWHEPADLPVIADSYHCSRYNTNTGRLTEPMFEDVFRAVRHHLDR